MSPSLDGCRIKIQRAHDARDVLNADVLRFRRREPYTVVAEEDRAKGEGVLRLQMTEAPPVVWSAIVGEIIHDTRSALDHLTWALAELEQGPAPDPLPPVSPWRAIQFPIADSPRQFTQAAKRQLWGVAPADRAAIEGLQPYKGPDVAQLRRIRDLSNIDKHRRLHLVTAMLEGHDQYIRSIRGEGCLVSSVEIAGRGALKNGAELARFGVQANGPNPRVYVDHDFTFDVTFDEGGPTTGWALDFVSILQVLAFGASGVIDRFASRFP